MIIIIIMMFIVAMIIIIMKVIIIIIFVMVIIIIMIMITRGQPCSFRLVPSGPPDPPAGCQTNNFTYSSFTVHMIIIISITIFVILTIMTMNDKLAKWQQLCIRFSKKSFVGIWNGMECAVKWCNDWHWNGNDLMHYRNCWSSDFLRPVGEKHQPHPPSKG